jgi:hypothetical protein
MIAGRSPSARGAGTGMRPLRPVPANEVVLESGRNVGGLHRRRRGKGDIRGRFLQRKVAEGLIAPAGARSHAPAQTATSTRPMRKPC